MLKFLLPFATFLLTFVESVQVASSAEVRLKYAITTLTGQFLNQQVQITPETSITTSTFPLISVLALLALYSSGFTQEELLRILKLENCDEIRSVVPKYAARFNTKENVKSELYFKAFNNISDPFTTAFKQDFKEILGGDTENINYSYPEEVASIINKWGKDHTSTSRGEDVIIRDEIPNDSGMVFVSTHDFQVNWNHPFNPKGMTDIQFKVNNNKIITMPALYGDGLLKFAVVDWLGCVVVEIPMKGGQHSGIVFFPDDVEGLPDLLNNLQEPDFFYNAIDMLEPRCITIYLPLGEANPVMDFRQNLEQIISTSIFDPALAEFCGISQGPNQVYVYSILHQLHAIGNAEVNESNMTTTTSSNLCDDSTDLPTINFDHPMAYYIMEKYNNIPIFAGLFYGNS